MYVKPSPFSHFQLSLFLTPHLLLFQQTRRSMVFAKHLRVAGDEFRNKHLQSTDEADRTHYNEDWTQMKVKSQQSVSRTKCNDLFHLCTPGCTLQGILEEPCESGSPCSG